MKSVGIDMKFQLTTIGEGTPNDILINGQSISKILDGLKIVQEGGCSDCAGSCNETSCGTNKEAKRGELDWNNSVIEDIPEALLKNAISKVIADSR